AVGDVAAHELDLAQIGERPEPEGLFRMPAGDPQARAPLQQCLRDMCAQEAAAPDQYHQPVFKRIAFRHGSSTFGASVPAYVPWRPHAPTAMRPQALPGGCRRRMQVDKT